MFGLAYLILVLVASIPLAMTILRHRGDPPSAALAHRVYRDLAYIALAALAILAFETTMRLALEGYWFAELGQPDRFWLSLGLQSAIFAAVLVVGGPFVAVNWRLAARRLANLPPSAPLIAGFVVAALVAASATGLWTPLAGFLGATPSGIADPVFGRDLSFYLLRLPVYEAAARPGDDAARHHHRRLGRHRRRLLSAHAAAPAHAVGHPAPAPGRGRHGRGPTRSRRSCRERSPPGRPPGTAGCRRGCCWARSSAWAARCCASSAAITWSIAGHSAVVAGASWIDVHVWLPAYAVIIAAWIAAALALAAAALSRPACATGSWPGPGAGRSSAAVLLAVYLAAQIVPAAVERLYVGPNQITLEQPYLLRSIAGTRDAYGLQGPDVQEQEFAVSSSPMTRADLDNSAPTLRDARIWDWRALEPQLQQTQGFAPTTPSAASTSTAT